MVDREARVYINSLLSIKHHEDLLTAIGFDTTALRAWVNSSPAASRSGTHLDTKSNFREADLTEYLGELVRECPNSWVKSTLNHQKIKAFVSSSLEDCRNIDVPKRARFDAEKTAKRIRLCNTSHMVFRHCRDFLILPVPCLSIFCPICSRLKAAKRVFQIREQLAPNLRKLDLRWMTLTIRNTPQGTLSDTVDRLLKAWGQLRKDSSYGEGPTWTDHVDGYLWNLEVTFNKRARTWHPHIHVLYDGRFYPMAELDAAWKTRLAQRGLEGKAIVGRAYYRDQAGNKRHLDKDNNPTEREIEACLEEVSKYTLAPVEARGTPPEAVMELAAALFSRRLRGSAGTMELEKIEGKKGHWLKAGSLSDITDPTHGHYLKNPLDQIALTKKASEKKEVWLNLVRHYRFFYEAQVASI